MRKIICVLIVAVLLCLPAMPAQAGRIEELRTEYQQLKQQRRLIEERLLRLEGMFSERQLIDTITPEIALPAEEAEEDDKLIIDTE